MTSTSPAPRRPRPLRATAGQIRSALTFFRISANLTGVFLLLLCIEMIAKWGFHYELIAGGINLSRTVLIIHGWLYLVYLFADFNLFSKLRWSLGKFLLIALGGVIPFLSFILERRVHREVELQLESIEESGPRYAA
ncbi:DUF3817 domain-containing protein [Falsarthrobacter nasiphocae]|uniref:Integral membrane protein n=1 Tax=Falsarthrobacter nasiphocae TaxID=189863 RepID=A0AAE3YII5_9MICC|nr:DUF3817 domain-containing protein [Falsarthrobacter nasiphocae]MDR6892573.1 integral membrane protein [Falsarthrobacter nasiphocae]